MSSGFQYAGANARIRDGNRPGNGKALGLARDEPARIGFAATLRDEVPHLAVGVRGAPVMSRAEARGSGFTGDQCSNCNSMRMKIAGHCMVCEDCGTTTGCS